MADIENEICKRIIILINENIVEAQIAALEEIENLLNSKKYYIIEQLLNENIISKLLAFLKYSNFEIQEKSLNILSTISTENEFNQTQLINLEILKSMPKLLSSSDVKIAQKSAEFLSKITVNSNEYIQAIFDADLIPFLIDLLYKDSPKAHKESASTLSNITVNGTNEQCLKLVDLNIIPQFCNLVGGVDDETILAVLTALKNILEKGGNRRYEICQGIEEFGGLRNIRLLKSSKNTTIWKLSYETEMFFNKC
uniref:Uncharacterized protein n=1 Tax=Panagrolaimus sp. PS1159 TaxID=55785 RepID=A0AC35GUW4_9BILA